MNIAKCIHDARKLREWSVDQLARKACIGRATVFRYEDPEYTNHSLTVLRQIADVLELKVEVNFEEIEKDVNRLHQQYDS